MNTALVALLIAPIPEMRKAILDGRKRVTIRAGARPGYTEGAPVMLCCHIMPWCVKAVITRVWIGRFASVPFEFIQADGFPDHGAALAGLREFYPNMTPTSPVTVVEWDRVEGALAAEESGR